MPIAASQASHTFIDGCIVRLIRTGRQQAGSGFPSCTVYLSWAVKARSGSHNTALPLLQLRWCTNADRPSRSPITRSRSAQQSRSVGVCRRFTHCSLEAASTVDRFCLTATAAFTGPMLCRITLLQALYNEQRLYT